MARRIPAHIREQQIDNLPNITFVRWDGEYRNNLSKCVCRCDLDGFEWSASVNDLVNGRKGCPQCVGKRRWTADERIGQVNTLPDIMFVRWDGEYRSKNSKAIVKCAVDDFEWSTTVNNLVNQGTGCPRCAGNRRIPAHVREQQINSLPDITFIRWDGEYRNSRSKAVCRCDIDGFEWSAIAGNLLSQGTGCPQCSGKRHWTSDERVEQINSLSDITFIRWDGEYRGVYSKAVCRCVVGHKWVVSITNLLNKGSGCPQCAESGYKTDRSGTLYALRSECGTMVKIGISNDYKQRHTTLKRKTPFNWSCVELIHGDGATIAALEKAFHGMTESVSFDEPFDGYTEWRKWTPELTGWFDTWKSLTPKENENV